MNLFSCIRLHFRRNNVDPPQPGKVSHLLDGIRFDADLSLEVLSSVLTSFGTSVLNTAAWRHEDVRVLLHHPHDIAVSVCGASIYLIAALAARVAARSLRQRRITSQGR